MFWSSVSKIFYVLKKCIIFIERFFENQPKTFETEMFVIDNSKYTFDVEDEDCSGDETVEANKTTRTLEELIETLEDSKLEEPVETNTRTIETLEDSKLEEPIEINTRTIETSEDSKSEEHAEIKTIETLEIDASNIADEKKEQSLVEKWSDNKIKIAEAHINIINSLQTTPEVKNVLIKYEKKAYDKYEKYKAIAQIPENAQILKHVFEKQNELLDGKIERYDEDYRSNMTTLADLYKNNGFNRTVLDMFNEIEDLIDSKKSLLALEESPRFSSSSLTTYVPMPYAERATVFSKNLELLQEDSKKFYNLYNLDCDINNLELHHVPAPNEDYTTYRDPVNKLEYTILYNGTWQVCPYDPNNE